MLIRKSTFKLLAVRGIWTPIVTGLFEDSESYLLSFIFFSKKEHTSVSTKPMEKEKGRLLVFKNKQTL